RNLARRAGWLPLPPVARGLQRMRAQQVTLGLFVGTTEPGWQLLRQEAPRELRAGEADSSIRVFRLPESDHTFSADRAKRELFRVFGEFIQTLRVP
ncbi:MAG: hypothetical protein KGJ64_14705, partial [Betaproteobacteria bacterium]|nr:hypothetical protein [Betaproteobacteria bacterium]